MKFFTTHGLATILFLIFAFVCLIAGCDSGPHVYQADRQDCSAHSKELAAFILECAKAANPMSDEEGEDLVAQCERTGERVICPTARFQITKGCSSCSELYREKVSK